MNCKQSIVHDGILKGIVLATLLPSCQGHAGDAQDFSRFLQQSGGMASPAITIPVHENQKDDGAELHVNEPLAHEQSAGVVGADDPLDTVDVQEGGNWLIKRQALEAAMDHIEQINNLYEKMVEARFEFSSVRSKARSENDLFLVRLGSTLKDLDAKVTEFLNRIQEEKKPADEEQNSELRALRAHKVQLQEIKEAAGKLPVLDAKLDEAVASIEPQVARARGYKAEAWRHFQAIKRVWNEERAEDLLGQTDALLATMQKLYNGWMRQELAQYVQEVMRNASSQIALITKNLAILSDAGIDLVQRIPEAGQAGVQKQVDSSDSKPEDRMQKEEASLKDKSSKAQSGSIFGAIESFFERLITTILKPFTWFKRFWS